MSFSGLVQTRDGCNELAKAELGESFQFSYIALGDGAYSGSFFEKTGLENEVMRLDISRITRKEAEVTIECDFDSKSVPEAFFFRELGIYANGKLCYYDNAGAVAEYLDPELDELVKQKRMRFIVAISNEVNVSVEIAKGLYVLQDEFDAHTNNKEIHRRFREITEEELKEWNKDIEEDAGIHRTFSEITVEELEKWYTGIEEDTGIPNEEIEEMYTEDITYEEDTGIPNEEIEEMYQ